MNYLSKMSEALTSLKGYEVIKQANPIISSTKSEILAMVDAYIEDLSFNGGNPIEDYAITEKLLFFISELQKGLKPYAIVDLASHDNNTSSNNGVEVKVVSTPAKFDYSANQAWVAQKAKVDAESAKLKEKEAFIKSLKESITTVDQDTGEMVTYYPPAKSSGETLRTSIA
jgi:hypothetical protein